MIKKLYGLLIIFVCMFLFSGEVWAATDHSLNYDIENFALDNNNQLTITGWAFIHNLDNYGGMTAYSYTSTWDTDAGEKTKVIYRSDSKLSVYFFFKNGENQTTPVYVNFENSDFTEVLCYKNGGVCSSSHTPSTYKNVRFSVSFSLDDYKDSMGSSEWNLMIGAKLGNRSAVEEPLAVNTLVATYPSGADKEFAVDGLGDKIHVTGNRVDVAQPNGSNVDYWKLTANGHDDPYKFDVNSRDCSTGICSYVLYYNDGYNTSIGFESACGFVYDSSIDNRNYVCTKPCNYGCSHSARILNVFTKPAGSVTIKYLKSEKVCKESLLNAQKLINNCEGTVGYSCGEMTVKINDNVSANISISENVSLDSKETSLIKVNAGMGFEYTMVYTDVVSWKILERSYPGTSQDNAIKNKVKNTYYKYNSSTLETVLNNSVKDVLNVQEEYGDANFAGSGNWDCGNYVESVNGDTITYTVTCEYTIKRANIDYYTGVIHSYGDGVSDHLDGGNRYYIPLRYPSNSTFNWNLQSGSDTLSVLELSYNVDDLDIKKAPDISIDTVSNVKNTCYVNVQNEFYNIESSGCSGAECVADSDRFPINGYKFIYRSISVVNPFPDDQIPQNWQKYIDNHGGLSRVHNSYNGSPAYVSKPTTITGLSGNFNYADKSDINADGNVSSVITGQYFTENYSKSQLHCKLGEYKDGECDTK